MRPASSGASSSATQSALTLDKAAATIVGGGELRPGAQIEYELPINIVGEYTLDNMVVIDTLEDGQLYDEPQEITLTVDGLGTTTLSLPGEFTNITFNKNNIADVADSTTGESVLTMRVSDALRDAFNTSLVVGPVQATLRYTATVQNEFTDTAIDGLKVLLPGDCLDNAADLSSDLVDRVRAEPRACARLGRVRTRK